MPWTLSHAQIAGAKRAKVAPEQNRVDALAREHAERTRKAEHGKGMAKAPKAAKARTTPYR